MSETVIEKALEIMTQRLITIEGENKTLSDANSRLLEAMKSVRSNVSNPCDTTMHNVKVAIGWVVDLL